MNGAYASEVARLFQGPAGQLEARISKDIMLETADCIGIVCHPHPLHQGTMDNKVVTAIVKAWQHLGLSTIRFNFRGVGESAGVYGEGIAEVNDLSAIVQSVQDMNPKAKLWLGGFSFGAFIATQMASLNRYPIHALLTIAPPIHLFDFSQIGLPPCPWILMQGELDELVSYKKVEALYQQLKNQKSDIELIRFQNATHFFHGQLVALKDSIEMHMKGFLGAR